MSVTAKNLRKIVNKYRRDPDTYGGILAQLKDYAELGMSNTCLRYKPTKKNQDFVEYIIDDLTDRGFKVFYNNDNLLTLDIEW